MTSHPPRPQVFAVAWRGGETARPALQKLLGTWRGVFPDHVLAMAQAEMQYQDHVQYHGPQGAQTAPHYPAWAAPQQYQGAHGAAQYAAPLPAAAAPQYPPVTQPRYSHQPAPAAQHQHYAAPAPLVPRYKTPPPGMCHPTPRPGSGPTVPLPDLLSSLLAAGVLGGAKAAGVAEAREPSLEFSSEIIKVACASSGCLTEWRRGDLCAACVRPVAPCRRAVPLAREEFQGDHQETDRAWLPGV